MESCIQKIYKDNLVHRFGGELDFEMTIIDYTDRLMFDNVLQVHFRRVTVSSFRQFQRELLDLAFLEQSSDDSGVREMKLRLYPLIRECGLNKDHFDLMKAHFVESLRHSWVPSDVIKIASNHLESIRYMFANDFVASRKKSVADHQNRTGTRSGIQRLAVASNKTSGERCRLQK